MNRGQIRTQAALFAGDPNLTRFNETQYNDAIQRAQEQFAVDSRALYKDAPTITVVAGTSTYDLPTDFWLEKRVEHKGIPLDPITRARLGAVAGQDWTDDEGTPRFYIIDPEEGRKQLRLYPEPQGGDAGANLVLTYYPLPAEMASDSSTPLNASALMVQFHIGLAAYAAWLLLGAEEAKPEILAKMSKLYQQYQDKVTEAIDTFGNTKSDGIKIQGRRVWR